MCKPLVFISHKHADRAIASVISSFLKEKLLGKIDVFQSSDNRFQGPRFGANLNKELQNALWDCDTLILVYTSSDADWSYCMYECGVATHPGSPDTKIIVFQCGKDVPTPFQDQLRVNAYNEQDFKKFTQQLMTGKDFFPSLKDALAPDVEKETLDRAGKEFFETISKVIPEPPSTVIEEWTAWPFLQIELSQQDVKKIANGISSDRLQLANEVIKENAIIAKSDHRISQLFGLAYLPEKWKFHDLLKTWKEKYPEEETMWFDSCCEQIMTGARREFPVIKMACLIEVDGDSLYTPVLSRIKYLSFANIVQFDIYFYNLNDPRAVPVTERMIEMGNFFYKQIGLLKPDSIKLKDLVQELGVRGLNRVPVLNDQKYPMYIIHRSMIDQFVANNIWGKSGISPDDFSLQHLLDDPLLKDMFEKTFVVVSSRASMAEAKNTMIARPGCSDVFVTLNGKADEPVKGWLTNIDIAKNS